MTGADWGLLIAEVLWLIVVGIGWPIYAATTASNTTELRGLNLPRGSVRAILALVIIGSFVIFLVFMPFVSGEANSLDKALVAFGTLSGAVSGFYFGGRTGTSNPVAASTPARAARGTATPEAPSQTG